MFYSQRKTAQVALTDTAPTSVTSTSNHIHITYAFLSMYDESMIMKMLVDRWC